jgi:hypothetical protein
VQFGEFVQIAPVVSNNTMLERTTGGITVYPLGTRDGAVLVYLLASNKFVSRVKFTVLPMPDYVVAFLNGLAAADKVPISGNVIVELRRGGHLVNVSDEHAFVDLSANLPSSVDAKDLEGADLRRTLQLQNVNQDAFHQMTSEDEQSDSDYEPSNSSDNDDGDELEWESGDEEVLRGKAAGGREIPDEQSASKSDSIMNIGFKSAFRKNPEAATRAMLIELTEILKKSTFHGVAFEELNVAERNAIIRCFLFFKEKFAADGTFERLKARLTAMGNQAKKSLYTAEEVTSPTASITSIFTLLCIIAMERRKVIVLDIKNAYLNAKRKSKAKIHMWIPSEIATVVAQLDPEFEPFITPDGRLLVEVDKALYGLVDSARAWYDLVSEFFQSLGFLVNKLDPCVFNLNEEGKAQVTVVVYVDDFMLSCADHQRAYHYADVIEKRFGESKKQLGPKFAYLGMEMEFVDDCCVVRMTGYEQSLLKDVNASGKAKTPAANELFDVDDNSPALSEHMSQEFHSVVMRLMYLVKRVRVDMLLPVAFLATRVTRPLDQDLEKLRRVLRYLNAHQGLSLMLGAAQPEELTAAIDVSYAVHRDMRSHTGFVQSLGRGVIDARSVKQQSMVKSSAEGEFMGVTGEAGRFLGLRQFLIAQGVNMPPVRVLQDNTSTISMLHNPFHTSVRTRHINIGEFWLADRIEKCEMVVQHCPRKFMFADLLSTPRQGSVFVAFRNVLMGRISLADWFKETIVPKGPLLIVQEDEDKQEDEN